MADGNAVTFDDDGAFYLKPGPKATFSGLKDHQKYYVEEIGVKSDEYDDIKINDVTYTEYTESENEEGKKVKDIRTSQVVAENRSAIRFSTLNAICKALDCQPGDILEYQEDED